ncbi:MAG: hypothetical protein K2X38_08355 [Gemmataceae bacterium]|nr:hypothetical protein [Gemmataceae bacterium]
MTAEIAVMNRIGVALAADSAVTISAAQKIYTSANKLFQLSASAPVGVMIYGNASFVNMPWETIIKAFRKQNGTRTFGSLEEYCSAFLAFLTHNTALFPESTQIGQLEQLLASLFIAIREEIGRQLDLLAESNENGDLSVDDISEAIDGIVERWDERIKKHDLIEGIADSDREKAKSKLKESIEGLRVEAFGELPFSERAIETLNALAIESWARTFLSHQKSGFVLAGFGENEYLPSLVAFEFEEMFEGIPRRKLFNRQRIDDDTDACIIPFAQKDPVQQFLEGIDQRQFSAMKRSAREAISSPIETILEVIAQTDANLANVIQGVVRPEIEELTKQLFDAWEMLKKDQWEPVLDTVAVLPKDELAAMSEALVNLTKFKRRVTPEQETVGGPIDVAVITKGDGFVWLKRKHYFDPTLNPRIMARYQEAQ